MLAWDRFLGVLEKELGKDAVETWVKPLKLASFDARNIYLEVSDPLKITWFNEYVRPYLRQGFLNNNGKPIKVHLVSLKEKYKNDLIPSSFQILPDRLDPELTFENFIVTPENKMGYTLLKEGPSIEFNPIFIYGEKHTGKSHLLSAFANLLKQRGKNGFYVRAETFTNHVVQAIRLGKMIEFRNVYRNIDALIIDDIDFFKGKIATQEEFFHTFNSLHTLGKLIVLSATSHPTNLPQIEHRLTSRFEWGITLEIKAVQPLDILKNKAAIWKIPLSIDLIEFIATTFPKDPLVAMQALSLRSKGRAVSLESAKLLLSDLIALQGVSALTVEKIIQKVAHHFDIKEDDLLGKSQLREISYPRQIAMYLMREKLKIPFQKIGTIFSRDHSTVMSSVRQIKKGIDEKRIPIHKIL